MPNLFEEYEKNLSKLEKDYYESSKKVGKIRKLCKELENLRGKYQNAKKKGNASDLRKYYVEACNLFEKLKNSLIEQSKKQEEIDKYFKEKPLNELELKTKDDIKEDIKNYFGIKK
ncbi:MAG: hypothetical protein IJI84_02260 [Clostridia bacterium]|nr:hypothetical protein [Clostridia bacterium]